MMSKWIPCSVQGVEGPWESSQAQSGFKAPDSEKSGGACGWRPPGGPVREVPCRRLETGVDRWGRGSWGPESLLSRTHIMALGRQCGLNILARTKYIGVFQEALLVLHRLSEAVFMKSHTCCVSLLKSSRRGCSPAL